MDTSKSKLHIGIGKAGAKLGGASASNMASTMSSKRTSSNSLGMKQPKKDYSKNSKEDPLGGATSNFGLTGLTGES
jgi:hypothetical protein